MIYRADIIKTDTPDDVIGKWKTSINAQSSMPGFMEAKLHRVYKHINKSGYQLISITRWQGKSSYDASMSNRTCYAYVTGKQNDKDTNLYTVANQGCNLDEVSTPGNLIVTNPYRIKPNEAAKHAEMWDTSMQHMRSRDGFVSAYLYQCVNQEDEYFFVSRAEWRSEELFMRQFEGKDFRKIIAPFEGIFSICLSSVVNHVNNVNQGGVDR